MEIFFSNRDEGKTRYNHLDQIDAHFGRSTILLLFSSALLILSAQGLFHSPVNAQSFATNNALKNSNYIIPVTSNQPTSAGNGNHITLKPAGTNYQKGQPPILTNISSKGIYKVQLRWITPLSGQVPMIPKSGFGVQILFMNGTGKPATSKTIPQKVANAGSTTMGVGTQYTVPGSIERLVPVSSFDMTIYGTHGKVLWNKTNQPVTAGRGFEQVVLPGGYTGDITILIHNIKSNNVMTGSNLTPLSTPLSKGAADSVDFLLRVG